LYSYISRLIIFIADFDSAPNEEETFEEFDEFEEFEDDIDFEPVFFNPCPHVIVASFNIHICEGDSIQIEGFGGSAAAAYTWAGGTDLSCINCPSPTVSPDTTTVYSLTISEVTGCSASNFTKIIVNEKPELDLGPDQAMCTGIATTFVLQ